MESYWILEYIKVFLGYGSFMFLWPTVVFWKHLRQRTKIYWFGFCVTTQIVTANIVVLGLGLCHCLNTKLVIGIFYGIFLIAIGHRMKEMCLSRRSLKMAGSKLIHDFWKSIRPGMTEYALLLAVICFGMIYFSYGAFQIHTYGEYDILNHHGYVEKLVGGTIFPEGIYPEAMHCFIYCIHVLFGIRSYSIMLFLQCIHVSVFLLSGYCLMREVFQWRYTPILVLALYLTIDFGFMYSMSRLQSAFPMEFGLHTVFLCARYLVRYLHNAGAVVRKGKTSKCFWDDNLFLFIMSLTASLMIHYHVTIIAFVVCASVSVFHIKKMVCPKYLIPLAVSIVCGCGIAFIPVGGAYLSGIPFEGSIFWGLNAITGEEGEETEVSVEETSGERPRKLIDPTAQDQEIIGKLPPAGQMIMRNMIKTEYLLKELYPKGYQGMYGEKRGGRIAGMTLVIVLLCVIGRLRGYRYAAGSIRRYAPFILISVLCMVIFAAYNSPELGLPVLIPDHRFCSTGHLFVLAVMMIPADMLLISAADRYSDRSLQIISAASVAGIYGLMHLLGIYHDYLYFRLGRYDASVYVTNSIIEEFPQNSYTIVSPMEDAYQIAPYGEHEEISAFFEKCAEESYSLPTEYVFIYVEKKPIEYQQIYYFNGPVWLGKHMFPSEIKASEISGEAARKELTGYQNASWGMYSSGRVILESKVYEWCRRFLEQHPSALNIYYEDENIICYYFEQDPDMPYELAERENEG